MIDFLVLNWESHRRDRVSVLGRDNIVSFFRRSALLADRASASFPPSATGRPHKRSFDARIVLGITKSSPPSKYGMELKEGRQVVGRHAARGSPAGIMHEISSLFGFKEKICRCVLKRTR